MVVVVEVVVVVVVVVVVLLDVDVVVVELPAVGSAASSTSPELHAAADMATTAMAASAVRADIAPSLPPRTGRAAPGRCFYDLGVDAHEQLSPIEARILGALIEKAGTTPDNYPLSTNALVAACNQSTNRDPVVDYAEREVDQVMMELRQRGLARTLSGTGHRVPKHRHVIDEAIGLDGEELAVLAVLLLRGAQTRNEITTRTERYDGGPEGDAERVDAALDRLASRPEPLIVRLERRPGEREPRVDQLWTRSESATEPVAPATVPGDDGTTPVDSPAPAASPPSAAAPAPSDDRVGALEAQVAELTARVARLESELGVD